MNIREKITAQARVEFLNALSHGHYDIEHKVKVHDKMADGIINYNKIGDDDYKIKSIRMTRKVNKDGGIETKLKIVIE